MYELLASILIVITGTTGASTSTCLSCIGVTSPDQCRTVQTCQLNENCFVEAYVPSRDPSHILYDLGCRNSGQCAASPSIIGKRQNTKINVCTECCKDDICNSGGCGHTGFPNSSNRGPICYSCNSTATADSCNIIQICAKDEICRLQEDHSTYLSTCLTKDKCLNWMSYLVGGRKRMDHALATPTSCKIRCCDTDLCNSGCGNATILTTPTTTTTQQPHMTSASVSDPCIANPCIHGTCSKYLDTYRCTCAIGFHGRNCDVSHQSSGCSPNPCVHGQCMAGTQGYTCLCYVGFTGKDCDTELDHCIANPCYFGSCTNEPTGFTCTCDSGYTGHTCDTVIDHCASSPCRHGNCTNSIHGYHCQCELGYIGTTCNDVSGCVYNGTVYDEGDEWDVGCDYHCTCENKNLGFYRCGELCKTKAVIPTDCQSKCNTQTLNSGCYFQGVFHAEGSQWTEGCSYNCTCENGINGFYRCSDLCLHWANLPSSCQLRDPEPGYCCKEPECPPSVIVQYPPGYIKA